MPNVPKTILVVDDDPSIVNLLKEDLQIEGYQVVDGYDGRMALDQARSARPDLIILDVNMPLLGGLKALETLRETPETREIPVLFLTGEAPDHIAPQLATQSRVSQVKKPIDLDDFNAIVKALMEKYPVEPTQA